MGVPAKVRAGVVSAVLVIAAAAVSADTLVMRDGRRISGRLVSVRNDTVEFEQRGGGGSRTLRLNRNEIRAIELDDSLGSGYDERPSGDRPNGMRERLVIVSADLPMIDTGIEVRAGQTVYFEASGTVNWGPGRRNGPEGEHNSPYYAKRPMPNRPSAALIGTIGRGSTDYFFIGAERGPIRMRANGRLFLGINDDTFQENRGNFRVTVYY